MFHGHIIAIERQRESQFIDVITIIITLLSNDDGRSQYNNLKFCSWQPTRTKT